MPGPALRVYMWFRVTVVNMQVWLLADASCLAGVCKFVLLDRREGINAKVV